MQIIIENCSSPGAHFSKNTNEVLLKIYKWIMANNKPELTFIDFRRRLEKEANINDNNARNIYPLLKNCGLVEYQPGGELRSGEFFTKRGLAYIKALETKDMIIQSDYSKQQKVEASLQVDKILATIVCDSLEKVLRNKELHYCESLKWYLMYLDEFGKISKHEFAYMVYVMSNNSDSWKEDVRRTIDSYRNNEADIVVSVRVRNDQKIQQMTGEKTRIEDISYFTAYSFYSGLVNQAGLTKKVKDYHFVVEGKEETIKKLLEV